MRADDSLKPNLRALARMRRALDKAARESHKIFVETEAPEVPKGVTDKKETVLKTEADTPLRMPARDLLKILSH